MPFRMNTELCIGSTPFLHVTWKIPDFFQLARQSGYSLRSPEFSFSDDRYCLRLYPDCSRFAMFLRKEIVDIELVKLNDTVRGKNVSYEVGLKSIAGEEIEINRRGTSTKQVYYFPRSELERKRNLYFPDGTLTLFSFVRLREPCSGGSPNSGGVETQICSNFVDSSSQVLIPSCGELFFDFPQFKYITWKIPDFQPANQSGYPLQSPEFPFADGLYCLRLFPSWDLHCKYIYIELINLTDGVPGTAVSYEIGLKSRKEIGINCSGTTPGQLSLTKPGSSLGQVYMHKFFVELRTLEEDRDSYFPDGTLTVFCAVRLRESSSPGGPMSCGTETQIFSSSQSVEHLMSSLVESSDEEEEQEGLPGVAMLQPHLGKILEHGTESDTVLVVSGQEFRAHRWVLRARSSVFDAIFDHEEASGWMIIDDLDSESFGDFLEYLYTGTVGAGISDGNAFRLYEAADKYDVPTLKSECVAHMRRTVSVDTFCDVITLALRHQEQKLLRKAFRFFKENVGDITVTVKWLQFVTNNFTTANDLFMKAHTSL